MSDYPDYKTVKRMAEEFPDVCCVNGLRWQIFNSESNGLKEAGAIIRIGRKVLIDVEKYFQWVYAQQVV